MNSSTSSSDNNDPTSEGQSKKLMIRGHVCLKKGDGAPVEVKRGMSIRTRDDREAGKIAAVAVDTHSQQVTHVVLRRQVRTPDYRLVPVDLIEQVNVDAISLRVFTQVVESLPKRQTP